MRPTNFHALCARWLKVTGGHLREGSLARYQTVIAEACKVITSLGDDLPEQLHAWEIKRRAELSPASFTVDLGVIKSILDWGRIVHRRPARYCGWNEIKSSKCEATTFAIPTKDQFNAIVTELRAQKGGETVADLVELLGASGMRHGELGALQWKDVDFAAGTVLVGRDGNSKTGKSRVLPMFDRVRRVLQEVWDKTSPGWRLPDDRIFGEIQPEYRLKMAYAKLGYPHFRVHDYRHFFAVTALKAVGIEQAHVSAAWCGHSVQLHLTRYTAHIAGNQSQELAKLVQ